MEYSTQTNFERPRPKGAGPLAFFRLGPPYSSSGQAEHLTKRTEFGSRADCDGPAERCDDSGFEAEQTNGGRTVALSLGPAFEARVLDLAGIDPASIDPGSVEITLINPAGPTTVRATLVASVDTEALEQAIRESVSPA